MMRLSREQQVDLATQALDFETRALDLVGRIANAKHRAEQAALKTDIPRYRTHLICRRALELATLSARSPRNLEALAAAHHLVGQCDDLHWQLATSARHVALAEAQRIRENGSIDEMDDRIQEGMLGLLEAARRWDPEVGVLFSTYARYWVRALMWRAVGPLRSDAKVSGRLFATRHSAANLSRRLGTEDPEILAAELGEPVQLVALALSGDDRALRLDARLDYPDREGTAMVDRMADESALDEDDTVRLLDADRLRAAVGELAEDDRELVTLRYGLDTGHPRSLAHTGTAMGWTVSKERVRQRLVVAQNRLRERLAG